MKRAKQEQSQVEISVRSLWTLIHGMGFGGLYLLACSGALVEMYRFTSSAAPNEASSGQQSFLRIYLIAMVVLAWFSVLSGAYIVYPWYRAAVPPGTANLALYPQRLLLSAPTTSGWHSLGMEWKEHVAWFAPISITMVAFVFLRYGNQLKRHPRLRVAVLGFTLASFTAAGIAGFFGAMINKYAPIEGGGVVHLRSEAK
jgi:hypothetical protein